MTTQERSGRGIQAGLAAALYLGAVLLGAAVGCGGSTTGGTAQPAGSAGSGGDGDRDAGPGIAGRGTGGSGQGGAAQGGAGGAGGAICECAAIGCGPGFHSVDVPGQCCPSCVLCGPVNCPASDCAAGEIPVTLPGQCCPTACTPGPAVDAGTGSTCPASALPDCLEDPSRPCPATWAEARSVYGTCDPPPTVATYLAACGAYHALVFHHYDGADQYYYDAYGALVGHDFHALGSQSTCERFERSFSKDRLSECTFESNCGVGVDAGPPRCGDGVLDPGESCDRIVGEQTCASATQGALVAGILKCNPDCTFDVGACHH